MFITAIVCCVNYSDFLSWFLTFNKNQFQRTIVITTPSDLQTIQVCNFHHVQCLQTNAFYEHNQVFGKAEGINEALNLLKSEGYDGWICHLDSDIVLPPRTMDFIKTVINETENKEKSIYSIDRFKVVGFEDWVNFLSNPKPIYEQEVWLRSDMFTVFPRVFSKTWVPIGYFQLWHSSQTMEYPTTHENAARADMLFGMQWERKYRHFIPEAICFHLESELCEMGTNWNGRATKLFQIENKEKKIDIKEIKSENVFSLVVNHIKELFFSNSYKDL